MQPISDNHYFISKENATLESKIFLPFARENLRFSDRQIFGKDWKKNVRESWSPPAGEPITSYTFV